MIWFIVLMFHLTLTRPEELHHTHNLCGRAVKPGLIKLGVIHYIYFTWKTLTIKHNKQQQMRWIWHKGWKLTNSLENLPVSHNFFHKQGPTGARCMIALCSQQSFFSASCLSQKPSFFSSSLVDLKWLIMFDTVKILNECIHLVCQWHMTKLSQKAHIHKAHQNIHQDDNKMEINLLQMGIELFYR